jgi:hypothetical protein
MTIFITVSEMFVQSFEKADLFKLGQEFLAAWCGT